jgi:hypothetical protein
LGRKLKLGRDLVVWFVKFLEGFVERHVLFWRIYIFCLLLAWVTSNIWRKPPRKRRPIWPHTCTANYLGIVHPPLIIF